MGLLVIFIAIMFFVLGYHNFKTLANPVTIFNGAWVLCLVCCEYFILTYGAYKVSLRMYIFILISIIVFSGTILFYRNKIWEVSIKNLIEWQEPYDCINYKLIIIFNMIAFFVLLPFLKSSIAEMQATSLVNVRANRMLGTGTEFVWQTIIKNVFVFPIYLSTIYIAIDAFIFGYSEHKWKLLVLAFVDAIMYTITYLGRLMIIQVLLFVALTYCFYRLSVTYSQSEKNKKMLKKVKKVALLLMIIAIGSLVIITSQRKSNNSYGIFYTIVTYFGGSVKFCDIELQLVDQAKEFTWGGGLFSGFWDYVLMVIQRFFGVDFLRPQEIIGVYNGDIASIGGGMVMTAFATVILNMYVDGGLWGIVFDSVVLAIVVMYFFKRMFIYPDSRHRLFATQMLMIVSSSALHWEGNRITAFAVFFFFVLFVSSNYGPKIVIGTFRIL